MLKISKQIFPEKEYGGLSPNFHTHASVSDLYIPTIGLPILLEEIAHRHMNLEIGAEAALFPEKEYISGIFVAVLTLWQSFLKKGLEAISRNRERPYYHS